MDRSPAQVQRANTKKFVLVAVFVAAGYLLLRSLPMPSPQEPRDSEPIPTPEVAALQQQAEADVARLIPIVETLRGLRMNREVPVRVLERDAFQAAYYDRASAGQDPKLLYPSGFYSTKLKEIVLSADALNRASRTLDRDLLVVHELAHALRDQTTRTESFIHGAEDDDGERARDALSEGEAELLEALYLAKETGRTPRDVVLAMHDESMHGTHRLVQATGEPRKEGGEDDAYELFTHLDGKRFVTELYLAGGLPFIDFSFAHPPRSTLEIMAPERYFFDDPPVHLPTAARSKGRVSAFAGSRGAYLMRTELDRLGLSQNDAAALITRLRGESFTYWRDPSAGVWYTSWKDVEARDAYARAIRSSDPDSHEIAVREQNPDEGGARFILMDGIPAVDADEIAGTLQGPTAESPSVNERPPLPPYVRAEPAESFEHGIFSSRWAGISLRVPTSVHARFGKGEEAVLTLSTAGDEDLSGIGVVTFSRCLTDGCELELNPSNDVAPEQLSAESRRKRVLPVGEVDEYRAVFNGKRHWHVIAIPMCQGVWVVVKQSWTTAKEAALANEILESIRRTPELPTSCDFALKQAELGSD